VRPDEPCTNVAPEIAGYQYYVGRSLIETDIVSPFMQGGMAWTGLPRAASCPEYGTMAFSFRRAGQQSRQRRPPGAGAIHAAGELSPFREMHIAQATVS